MEIWKKIKGFEELYHISSTGRVKSLRRDMMLKPNYLIKSGRPQYTLQIGGKKKYCKGHRLVAEAFIPIDNKRPHINHIDNNVKNNSVSNLEWCTHAENIAHCVKQGRNARGEKNHKAKLREFEVIEIFKSKKGTSFLARQYGVSAGTISFIRKGDTWKHITADLMGNK